MIRMTIYCVRPTQSIVHADHSMHSMLVWSVFINFNKMFICFYHYICTIHLYFTR